MPFRLLSTLCLLGAICLASLIILVPSTGADKPGFTALFLLIAGLILLGRSEPPKGRWAFWYLVLPVAALLLPMIGVVRAFRRLDMVSLLFHTQADFAGAGLEGLGKEVLQAVLLTLTLISALYGLARLWALRKRGIAGLALFLLAINPLTIAVIKLALIPKPDSDLAERLTEPIPAARPDQPIDLVMIYIEGTDRQFADKAVWGESYAPLQAVADHGVAFTQVGQIVGTGWSLAGVVATQCGVPVVPRGLLYNTNFEELDDFKPGVRCLGDVLAGHGYHSAFVYGAKERFAGTDKLFKTHGFDLMIGRETLERQFGREELDKALIGWMLDDQMVLDAADRLHAEMAAEDAPYALVVETVGPHGANNFISRRCNSDGRSGFSGDLKLALDCTIGDVAATVTKMQSRQAALRASRPLLVVLLSDHLNHAAARPQTGQAYLGANTVIMAGAGLPKGVVVDKAGSMIDVLPTVLHAMELIQPPYVSGLGVSLLTDQPTLVKRFGIDPLEPMVLFDQALALRIWTPLDKFAARNP